MVRFEYCTETSPFFSIGNFFLMLTSAVKLQQSVVVFSKSFLPINKINVKRAIILLVSGKAEPLDLGNDSKPISINSATMVFLVPKYIRLTVQHKEKTWRVPTVNRKDIFKRDKYSCQYCGNIQKLTLDHVIPRSKGGGNSWDNIVTACQSCNNHKGARTPQQANMTLHSIPKPPVHPIVAFSEQFWREHKKLIKNI